MKVKLSDIANEMGVSIAAVSMALNNKGGIGEETREEILKTAERMGYKARKASKPASETKEPRFIKLLRIKKHGMVVMETEFFAAVIQGIENQCRKMGYQLLIANVTLSDDAPQQIAEEYHDDVDGMISLCTELDEEDIRPLMQIRCPQVVIDRKFVWNVNTVLMNNQKGTRQAVEYLYQKGHTEIGYLKSNTPIYNFKSRFKSYLESIERLELQCQEQYVIELDPSIEGAYQHMKAFLKTPAGRKLPTAFVADNDNIALGVMNALKESGIRIPEQVSLIGVDDMPFCKIVDPPLTTIKVYKEEIGRQAVKMLVEEIVGDSECTKKMEVDTVLVERSSVKVLTE
ncbi:LacI family DNA-binding transcriptional regulator [Vallitaleaceae bacterium 9-2]